MLAADDHQTAFIVTDAGMMATGIVDRALSSLAASGITTGLYTNVGRIHLKPLCMRRLTRRARPVRA